MSVQFLVTVLFVFMTIFSSVILLKFWMDFKLEVWDRQNQVNFYNTSGFSKQKYLEKIDRDKLYNKKQSDDIIIDCEVEVINGKEHIYVQSERLLK